MNNKARFPEYSQVVPMAKLGDHISELVGGAPLKPSEILDDGDYKIIPKKAIQAGGKLVLDDKCSYVTKEVFEKYTNNTVDKTYSIVVLRDLVPSGPNIGYVVANESVEEGVLAQGVYGLKFKETLYPPYLIQYSNTSTYRKLMQTLMVGSTQVHIRNTVYTQINIPLPSYEEQQKIADFLSSVDEVIAASEEEVEKLEEQKKGMMQRIFNQEVRFKKDDGSDYPEWSEKTFADTFTILGNNTLSRDKLNYESGEVRNVHYGDVLIRLGAYVDAFMSSLPLITAEADAKKASRYLLQDGDIVIADTAEDETVGKATEIVNCDDVKVVSGLHTIPCRPQSGWFALKYLGYYMNSYTYHSQLLPLVQGTKVSSISKSAIAGTKIHIPCIEEQQKIAEFFSSMDDAINSAKEELEHWKEIKKGLLQQMFV